jgi:hypothetical protein
VISLCSDLSNLKIQKETHMASLPSFSIVQQFTGNDGVTASSPFVIPPNLTYSGAGSPFGQIVVTINNVAGQSSGASCKIATNVSNTDFQLDWANQQAVVTVIPNNVWAGAAAKRTQLRNSFDAFRQQLEALEIPQQGPACLKPGGAFLVAQRVAEALPLSLDESLYYRYSFDRVKNYIDLQPGMRLRIEYSSYQFFGTTGQSPKLNGYAANGVGYYNIVRRTDQRVAFDSFLGQLTAPTPDSVTCGLPGAGGIIDLQIAGMARRYYRLFYPPTFTAPDCTGDTSIKRNVTLIGADTLADLYDATSKYALGKCATAPITNPAILCTTFRGRDIVIPELLVRLNYQQSYVPVGTTVRNLVDQFINSSFSTAEPLTGFFPFFSLFRQWGPLLDSSFQPTEIGFGPVDTTTLSSGQDVFDLPVIKGDALSLPNLA